MQLLIGLGGNQGDVPAAFLRAVAGLDRRVRVLARSSVWRSAPLGPPQPDYLNAVLLVESSAHPLAILTICQRLEGEAGRDRTRDARWEPRPLDLDLLIAPGLVVEAAALTLPHPRLALRRFVLAPAAELAPDWLHPRLQRTLGELASLPAAAAQRCDRLGPFPGA